ncbi:MAG TPA: ribonuclease Z [Methanocorpusculum sp.]|nr:ribonuclease Z [Methanocorpusculum sp.]HJJ60267.1 ribonuclease Z [Methanocorpusculum sp.]
MSGETLFVHFLGTAGALPTPLRNPSCILIRRGSDTLLFDCGEGAQQQMMRLKTGFIVNAAFITHWHADHYLGLFGLIETMSFSGRTEPMTIYGPAGIDKYVDVIRTLTPKIPFVLEAVEVSPRDVIRFDGYSVCVFKTYHGMDSVGYVLEEDMRPGRFNREGAIALGVKPGPLFGKLQRGIPVEIEQGGEKVTILPEQVMGGRRPGRKIVYTGDTRPLREPDEMLMQADLLIHEATFDEEMGSSHAKEVWHSTAKEAGGVASLLSPKQLALVHISSRYTTASGHVREAKEVFEGEVFAPNDLTTVEIPFRDE